MRTRLDEILESFFGTAEKPVLYPDGARAAVRASLDHAFRHGVEQAWADCKRMIDKEVPTTDDLIYKYSHKTPVSAVQPAPAGEKCPWTFAAQMPCDKPNGHDGAHGPAGEESPIGAIWPIEWHDKYCLMLRGPIIRDCICGKNDRRKGERRKHGEAKNYVHDWTYSAPSRPMYQKDLYGAFFYDRRSGKDRRK